MKLELAIYGIAKDRPQLMFSWMEYYTQYVDGKDIFLINNGLSGYGLGMLNEMRRSHGCSVININNNELGDIKAFLLNSYEYVLKASTTDIIYHEDGLLNVCRNELNEEATEHGIQQIVGMPFDVVKTKNDDDEVTKSDTVMRQRPHWIRRKKHRRDLLISNATHGKSKQVEGLYYIRFHDYDTHYSNRIVPIPEELRGVF